MSSSPLFSGLLSAYYNIFKSLFWKFATAFPVRFGPDGRISGTSLMHLAPPVPVMHRMSHSKEWLESLNDI